VHAGESIARSAYTLVDYNRAGVPLMEIVSEPEISSAREAEEYLAELKAVMSYIGVSDVKMHEGSLRCDANVSIRPAGARELGTKVEIKNLNSFRSVGRAIEYEIERMRACVREGERIVQETRGWDEGSGTTHSMRSKELAHDYRYFPDPDLVPLELGRALLSRWRTELPELPAAKRTRYVRDFGLSEYDAGVLTSERSDADFFEAVAAASGNPKQAANWMMGDVRKVLDRAEMTLASARGRPEQVAALITLVANGTISGKAAKEVIESVMIDGRQPADVVAERGLAQTSDAGAVAAFVDQALHANADSVASYKAGKEKAFEFLVGQVMKLSRGKANVEMVRGLLKERLG